jgi:hypothetical protein
MSNEQKLRAALVGLVGTDDPAELRELLKALSLLEGIPAQDRAATVTAVVALLDTIPSEILA